MALLMTQADFAARHGVGKPAVTAWKKRDLLVFVEDPERPGRKLVDAEKSDLLVRGTIDQTRGRARGGQKVAQAAPEVAEAPVAVRMVQPAMSETEAARLEGLRERTRRQKIETEQLLGSLVPIAEYERQASELGRRVREGVHAIIRQVSERLAAESDPRVVSSLLAGEVDGLFDRLAAEIEAEAAQERAVDVQLSPLDADDDELEA